MLRETSNERTAQHYKSLLQRKLIVRELSFLLNAVGFISVLVAAYAITTISYSDVKLGVMIRPRRYISVMSRIGAISSGLKDVTTSAVSVLARRRIPILRR